MNGKLINTDMKPVVNAFREELYLLDKGGRTKHRDILANSTKIGRTMGKYQLTEVLAKRLNLSKHQRLALLDQRIWNLNDVWNVSKRDFIIPL